MDIRYGLSLTQTRYWYYHQTDEKQTIVRSLLNLSNDSDNGFFEKIRIHYHAEIQSWFDEN
jgi:hypothetical protein